MRTLLRVAVTTAGLGMAAALLAASHNSAYPNANAITPDRLRAHLMFVADDLLEGRDTPSRGLDIAARYIRSQLILWGIAPGGPNGSYFQTINLASPMVDATKSTVTLNGQPLSYGKDYYARGSASAQGSGSLVYVGHGWKVPKLNIDETKGKDLKGKFLVVLNGMPKGMSFRDLNGPNGEGAESAVENAGKWGAAGVIVILNDLRLDGFANAAENSTKSRGVRPQGEEEDKSAQPVPVIYVNRNVIDTITKDSGVSSADLIKAATQGGEAPAVNLSANLTLNANVVVSGATVTTQNVIGVIEGSDPTLKNEYVAIGAHYDHVGVRTTGADRIYNGADDDGSGTVSVLEIAHAFATGQRPKRSVMFVWHCGEEKGLWGSAFFTNNPTVPIGNIVAQLNIDMIGRSRAEGDTKAANKMLTEANAIYVVGSNRISRDLGTIVESTNRDLHGLRLDYHYDQPNDPENIYQRSDHYNYALKGIPIAFFFDGVHEDYHGVGDEWQKIDYTKMSNVAQTVYGIAWNVGNLSGRPRKNS